MPTFVPVSEEILDDRNGCNTQKNPLELNKIHIQNVPNLQNYLVKWFTDYEFWNHKMGDLLYSYREINTSWIHGTK